jgi:hypothetical protein
MPSNFLYLSFLSKLTRLREEVDEAVIHDPVEIALKPAVAQQHLQLFPNQVVVILRSLSPVLDLLNENIGQLQRVLTDCRYKFGVLSQIPMLEAELIIVVLNLQHFCYDLRDTLVKS